MIHPASQPVFFFFNDTATTEIYTLSLQDALPISARRRARGGRRGRGRGREPLSRLHGGGRRRVDRGRSPANGRTHIFMPVTSLFFMASFGSKKKNPRLYAAVRSSLCI